MPLQACNLALKQECVLGTLIPAKEEWVQPISDWCNAYLKAEGYIVEYFRAKFEVSNTGAPHIHVGIKFFRKEMAMFVRRLQKFMWAQFKHDKPPGYSRDTHYSVRFYKVPCVESVHHKVLHGTKVIDHYLDEPTKEKCVDGENYTLEFDGFNIAAEILSWRDETARGPLRDAPGDEYHAVRAAAADRQEAYVKKYRAAQKRGVELPELTKMILGNQPPIDRLAKDWKSFLAKSLI